MFRAFKKYSICFSILGAIFLSQSWLWAVDDGVGTEEFRDNNVLISNTDSTANELRFQENSATATGNYVGFKAAGVLAGDLIYQLPSTDPAANQVLLSSAPAGGVAALSWASAFLQNGNSFGALATLGTNDGNSLVFETNATEAMRIDTSGNLGIGTTIPTSKLQSVSASTSDEIAAIKGEAGGNGAGNQVVGIFGEASNTAAANTGSIAVLAVGNGNATAAQTNIGLQVNDGEIAMGRTTQALGAGVGNNRYAAPIARNLSATAALTVALQEPSTAGTLYTAQGPSGVVEIEGPAADITVTPGIDRYIWARNLTVNNRYARADSIIFLQVIELVEGTLTQAATPFALPGGSGSTGTFTFQTAVDGRAAGSFVISVAMEHDNTAAIAHTLDGGAASGNRDKIRIGYIIINPSR